MNPEYTENRKNRTAKFAKIIIFLVSLVVAAASATLYQESNSRSSSSGISASAAATAGAIEAVQSFMQGEPFSTADGVNVISSDVPTIKTTLPDVDGSSTRQSLLERFDHATVNKHSTAHLSDLPGASIAAY